jgi:hypothetical protein
MYFFRCNCLCSLFTCYSGCKGHSYFHHVSFTSAHSILITLREPCRLQFCSMHPSSSLQIKRLDPCSCSTALHFCPLTCLSPNQQSSLLPSLSFSATFRICGYLSVAKAMPAELPLPDPDVTQGLELVWRHFCELTRICDCSSHWNSLIDPPGNRVQCGGTPPVPGRNFQGS